MITTHGDRSVTVQGQALSRAPETFGPLVRSGADEDVTSLPASLRTDGYLYLPGLLDRQEVLAAREAVLDRLADVGWVDPDAPVTEARPGPRAGKGVLAELAASCPELQRVLYDGPMIRWYQRLFGQSVRHFDYTWLRAFPPGKASRPHMDSVFMNRGTDQLLTSWTPFGDIDTTLGGLAVMPGSHRLDSLNDYADRDVDVYCENLDPELGTKQGPAWDGALTSDPAALCDQLHLPWLTSDYRAGDLLTFTIRTVHVGLDNNADRLRLSSDSRYQPQSEPADPRWVGVAPSAHSDRSKRGLIC